MRKCCVDPLFYHCQQRMKQLCRNVFSQPEGAPPDMLYVGLDHRGTRTLWCTGVRSCAAVILFQLAIFPLCFCVPMLMVGVSADR